MPETFYRRPLPEGSIPFSSDEGRKVFAEALSAGGLDGYFPLAEQFHTQSEPSFCGLGSLVIALNALAIDPGRLWKGPWRWFGEELLDCCVPLEQVRARGLDLDELACLARCNGAEVALDRADTATPAALRQALELGSRAGVVLVASYDRGALGQTGTGHFSPLGGTHRARDLVLILDVARFKYPPHWVPVEGLLRAMQVVDPATGRPRGWLTLRARSGGTALGFSLECHGDGWPSVVERLAQAFAQLSGSSDVARVIREVAPLAARIELRAPATELHRAAIEVARAELRATPIYARVTEELGPKHAEGVALLLLASDALLPAEQQGLIAELGGELVEGSRLALEVGNLRAQVAALWAHLRGAP